MKEVCYNCFLAAKNSPKSIVQAYGNLDSKMAAITMAKVNNATPLYNES